MCWPEQNCAVHWIRRIVGTCKMYIVVCISCGSKILPHTTHKICVRGLRRRGMGRMNLHIFRNDGKINCGETATMLPQVCKVVTQVQFKWQKPRARAHTITKSCPLPTMQIYFNKLLRSLVRSLLCSSLASAFLWAVQTHSTQQTAQQNRRMVVRRLWF